MSLARPARILIAGGGFAAVEAGLALRALAGDGVELSFVAPEPSLRYRPAAPAEVFDEAPPRSYELARIISDLGGTLHVAKLSTVAPRAHRVRLSSGVTLGYDALVLAIGARAQASIAGARVFRDQRDVPALRTLLAELERGALDRLVLAVPAGRSWPLALYELALQAGWRVQRQGLPCALTIVTPEPEPLAAFGGSASRAVAEMLRERAIRFIGDAMPVAVRRDGSLALASDAAVGADQVITVPLLSAHRISGVPASWWGFVATDDHGRVLGLDDVYAAGDMTAYPIKQGGLAAQHADRVAHTIAQTLGAPVKQLRKRDVLAAVLSAGDAAVRLRAELDWRGCAVSSSAQRLDGGAVRACEKVDARYLAAYLTSLERRSQASVAA